MNILLSPASKLFLEAKGRFKPKFLLCLPLLTFLLPVQLLAAEDEGIEVSGQGSVVVVPDQFSLTVTITERGRVPNKLKSLVNNKSTSVVNKALSLGIKESDISSARVNLRIVEEVPAIKVQSIELNKGREGSVFVDGQNINQQQNTNNQYSNPLFEISRQIVVNFNSIDRYDDFLSDIIKINVSHISSLSMNVEKRDEYYQQALLQAISHAQQKANKMAAQVGRKLGELQFIKEVSSNSYRPMYAEPMIRSASSNAHTSLTGNQTISARVSVKFNLDD